jgi:hypothetical protein
MMKALCAVLAIAVFASSAAAVNNMDTCDSAGRYCFADAVFDCVNGTPQAVKGCSSCRDGECVDAPLAPDVTVKEAPPKEPARITPEFLGEAALVGTIIAIALLYARIRRRK